MLPRRVVPGTTYLLTRRCIERRFLLRPGPATNQIVGYCLAVAAQRTGVEVHAFCAMSNHVHSVVTDVEGRLPEFLQFFHRHVAVAMNASLGRVENFWSTAQSSAVELGDAEDILEKMAYVISNPTTAGLVRAPQEWPGVITKQLGETREIQRPKGYFRPEGNMPQAALLSFSLPRQLEHQGLDKSNELLFARVSDKVRAARTKTEKTTKRGQFFLEPKKVQKMRLDKSGEASEYSGKLNPRFAISDPRLRKLAMDTWRGFLLAYREALDQWRKGERSVQFPEGTWLMQRMHRAACAPPSVCAA